MRDIFASVLITGQAALFRPGRGGIFNDLRYTNKRPKINLNRILC
jgi:hypothetical protein